MAALRELALLIQSRYPLIVVETLEEERLERALEEVARSLRIALWVWTTTTGLTRLHAVAGMPDTRDALRALEAAGSIPGEALLLMKDLHRHLERPEIVRKLRDLGPAFSADRRAIVLSGARVTLPPELEPFEIGRAHV